MRVYHSSVLKVEKPLISYSRDFLDFGKGFYVTTILSQAENMLKGSNSEKRMLG